MKQNHLTIAYIIIPLLHVDKFDYLWKFKIHFMYDCDILYIG